MEGRKDQTQDQLPDNNNYESKDKSGNKYSSSKANKLHGKNQIQDKLSNKKHELPSESGIECSKSSVSEHRDIPSDQYISIPIDEYQDTQSNEQESLQLKIHSNEQENLEIQLANKSQSQNMKVHIDDDINQNIDLSEDETSNVECMIDTDC